MRERGGICLAQQTSSFLGGYESRIKGPSNILRAAKPRQIHSNNSMLWDFLIPSRRHFPPTAAPFFFPGVDFVLTFLLTH